ncbi:MAG: 3-deoxy-manno-octulosonate cytidylyltransferase [Candidatus Omnitrophica bacterium]|nr:3-deoxy-manno-octulosonate cytidylyltransferase [Candidatus Omnitrophota bacterium]
MACIIPARMASSRFPGKPLVEIRGLPMIEHVRRRAALCKGFEEVVVATCDRQIAQVVERSGGRVLMTSSRHPAATDRVAEAAGKLDCTHVVNVQGDEILVLPRDLESLVQAIGQRPELAAWNAVASLETPGELGDPSVVKCVVSVSGRILFCGRNFSHLKAAGNGAQPVRKILGILGYRQDFLQRYPGLARTPLETLESVDQSRILEHDVLLQGIAFPRGYAGINLPGEVKAVEHLLDQDPLQRAVLHQVLKG